jgi:hypothetical protein
MCNYLPVHLSSCPKANRVGVCFRARVWAQKCCFRYPADSCVLELKGLSTQHQATLYMSRFAHVYVLFIPILTRKLGRAEE